METAEHGRRKDERDMREVIKEVAIFALIVIIGGLANTYIG